MEDIKVVIAKNITELRKQFGLTQIELAEKLNYSDKSVSKWERAESVPDVIVLKEIADLFGVTLDYLVEEEHKGFSETKSAIIRRIRNHGFITGISMVLVWLIAAIIFFALDIATVPSRWLTFIAAVPVTILVWLIFNSMWFNKRRNFLIISLLMWSVLAAVFVFLLPFHINIWKIFILGIPGQFIIFMWSRIKKK